MTDKPTKNLGEPKTEAERAKEHFGISDEDWDDMTADERQVKIDDLPDRGEGQKAYDSLQETITDLCNMRIISKSEEEEDFIIGGYANVYMLDEDSKVIPDFDNDVITLEALDEGIKTMMAEPSRRNHMYYHTNLQIGEIIEEHTDSDGVTWKTHVVYEPDEQYEKKGLFILCRMFKDCPVSVETMDIMERGHMLAFSVGGLPLEERQVCDDDKCWNEISKFYLAEVTSCERGINAESKGFIIKFDKDTQCYYPRVDSNSNGYIGETAFSASDEGVTPIFTASNVETNLSEDGDNAFTSKQKEENNLTDNQENQIDCGCTDEETIAKVKALAEAIKAETSTEDIVAALADILWINADSLMALLAPALKGETELTDENLENLDPEVEVEEEEPTEPVEKEIETVSSEPKREDYGSFGEYAEAVVGYDEALKAKTPASKKEVEELKDQLAELKKALEEKTSDEIIGEVVKKSVAVKKAEPVIIDYDRKKAFLGVAQK